MLNIGSEQMGRMHRVAGEFFVDELLDHAKTGFPLALQFAGPDQLRKSLRLLMRYAEDHGFTTRGPVRLFADLGLLFGTRVGDDPFHPWIGQITGERSVGTEAERGERLHQATLAYFAEVITPEEDRMARALQRLVQFEPTRAFASSGDLEARMPEVLNLLYPAKLRRARPDAAVALAKLHAVLADSGPNQSPALSGWLACLKFYFGHHAERDPLHPWIEATLVESGGLEAGARLAVLRERTLAYARALIGQLRDGKQKQESHADAA